MKPTPTSHSAALTATSPGASSTEDATAIEAVLRQYIWLLNARDADFDLNEDVQSSNPVSERPDGTHTIFPGTEAVSKFLRVYLDAEAKSGRTGTEIEKVQISLLSKSVALAFVDYVVKRTDGNTKTGWVLYIPEGSGDVAGGIIGAPRLANYRGSPGTSSAMPSWRYESGSSRS